jgi:TPR repeat protein
MQIISPSHNRLRVRLHVFQQWGLTIFRKQQKLVKLAQFYLGTHYQYGKDVAKDDKQAFAWFKAAADQGLSPAQLNVGRMYADGIGVKKDESMARKYFEKAASNGDNRASYNLAMMEEQKKNYVGAYNGMSFQLVMACSTIK